MIDAEVEFLRRPESHPDGAGGVTVVRTHRSWVFLTGRYAWKLRRPVANGFVDLRMPGDRRLSCAEEVRLNRRFSDGVYLGVVPLTREETGEFHLDGPGEVVDWLVKMRRLPAERMLDAALRAGAAEASDLRRVVAVLVRAYAAAPAVAITSFEYRRRLDEDVVATAHELVRAQWGLPAEEVACVGVRLREFLAAHRPLLDARVRAGWVVEGHGDLRPEHICLEPEPQIIDCLDFSRDLRIADAADELAFLTLECERLGFPDVGRVLVAAWREASGDDPPASLMHAYAAYRACVRAKIAIWHWREADLRNEPMWQARAREYLRLADEHSRHLG